MWLQVESQQVGGRLGPVSYGADSIIVVIVMIPMPAMLFRSVVLLPIPALLPTATFFPALAFDPGTPDITLIIGILVGVVWIVISAIAVVVSRISVTHGNAEAALCRP